MIPFLKVGFVILIYTISYLTADYERRNFSIFQAIHQRTYSQQLVTIPSINSTSPIISSSNPTVSLPAGAIAGIAVGAAIILVIILIILFWLYRKRTSKKARELQQEEEAKQQPFPQDTKKHELPHTQTAHEFPNQYGKHEIGGVPIYKPHETHEMEGNRMQIFELESPSEERAQRKAQEDVPSPVSSLSPHPR